MEFGAEMDNDPRSVAEEAQLLEKYGFGYAWFPDVPTAGWGDPYACMALAATTTQKITIGTYITPAMLRLPAATVNAIATINAIAPERVILGMGSGSLTFALLGLPPLKVADFREQLQVIRDLLTRGEAEYEHDGVQHKLRFHNRAHMHAINLDTRIPLYVAASAPKSAALAGEFGDGLITATEPTPDAIAPTLAQALAAAKRAGRQIDKLPYSMEGPLCLLHAGETLESERVREITQPYLMAIYRFYATLATPPELVPAPARRSYEEYLAYVEGLAGSGRERYLSLGEGILRNLQEERRFASPEAVRTFTLTGTMEEVVERIQTLERAGLTQFVVWPRNRRWRDDDHLQDVLKVMERV